MAWWIYDFVIFGFLIFGGIYFLQMMFCLQNGSKRFLHKIAIIFLVLTWIIVFYGSFVESRFLTVRTQTVDLGEKTTHTLRAAVVSDFHAGFYTDENWIKHIVREIQKRKPDVIFLLGDFISENPEAVKELQSFSNFRAPLGVFAITGNHDYQDHGRDDLVVATLQQMGIRVLRNEHLFLSFDGEKIALAGIDDIWFGGSSKAALDGLTDEDMVILLAHNPDAVLFSETKVADLILSGHTHGGQIRLPLVGSLAHIPTVLGNTYDKGLFSLKDQWLFITSGVGEIGPRARLFNPPEIVLLNIVF